MTYKIYIESTGNIIVRGTVRVFNKNKDINVREMEIEEIKPENEQSQESKPILAETLESIKKSQDIATIDP